MIPQSLLVCAPDLNFNLREEGLEEGLEEARIRRLFLAVEEDQEEVRIANIHSHWKKLEELEEQAGKAS